MGKLHKFIVGHFGKLVAISLLIPAFTSVVLLSADRLKSIPSVHSAISLAVVLALGRMPNQLVPEGLFVVGVLGWILSALGWMLPLLAILAALRAPAATRAFFKGLFQYPRRSRWWTDFSGTTPNAEPQNRRAEQN